MTKQQKPKTEQKKSIDSNGLNPYGALRYSDWSPSMQLGAWLCVAAVAVAYLYFLLSGVGQDASQFAQDRRGGAFGGPAGSMVAAPSDQSLAGQIETLRREIAAMKQRERLLETRIADLQMALGPVTGAISSPATGPVEVERSPLPGRGFGDELAAKSPLPVVEAKQPTRTFFAVDLGQDKTLDDLRKRWLALAAKYPPQLKDLEARYALAGGRSRGAGYKLIAGPFSNAADAALVCARLKARKQACEQAIFSGEKLGEATLSLPERKPKRRRN